MEQLSIKFKPPHQKIRLLDKEEQIIKLLCQGVAPKEIATRMSPKNTRRNVHNYLVMIRAKLGARTTWQACAIYGSWYPNFDFTIHPSVDGMNKRNPLVNE